MISLARRFIERYIIHRNNPVTYYKSKGMKIGENSYIYSWKVSPEPWLIEIGNNVTVSNEVTLLTHDGSSRIFRDKLPNSSKFGNRYAPIIIKDNCFIGAESIIMPGVTIGSYSIVAAGSVVTKDVPPRTVVAGIPARKLFDLETYIERYTEKMIDITATDRDTLRRELTLHFWGEER